MQYTPTTPPTAADPTGIASVLTRGRKLMIVGAIMLIAFGYFGYTAFQSAMSFYVTVDELVELGPTGPSQSIQVKGTLVPHTFERVNTANTIANFQLQDGGQLIDATIDGVLPDLFFNPHSELVLSGTYDGEVFTADGVLIKCPSKYQSLEVENPSVPIPSA